MRHLDPDSMIVVGNVSILAKDLSVLKQLSASIEKATENDKKIISLKSVVLRHVEKVVSKISPTYGLEGAYSIILDFQKKSAWFPEIKRFVDHRIKSIK